MLDNLEKDCPESLAWATLLSKCELVQASNLMNRIKLSRSTQNIVLQLLKNQTHFSDSKTMSLSKLKKFVRQDDFDQLLELHRLDSNASSKDFTDYNFCLDYLSNVTEEELNPVKLLTGNDLVALGFKPGPAFKTVLSALECAQLDGTVTTRDAALAFVKQHLA